MLNLLKLLTRNLKTILKKYYMKKTTNTPLQLQVLPPMPCTPFSPSSSIKFPNIKFTQPIANH